MHLLVGMAESSAVRRGARREAAALLLMKQLDDGDASAEAIAKFRAQMLRQFMGENDAPKEGNAADQLLGIKAGQNTPKVVQSDSLKAGQVLLANPQRFCSRNPFSQPVRDLARFGLQGPIEDDELSSDMTAQMLPVLVLIEHGKTGSRGLLMERRTGALMGDVSMEEYGLCAVSPLWIGGTAKPNSLFMLHDVPQAAGANEVSSGLYLGGWEKLKPKVADSSVSEARLKFFVGATEWGAGQLEKELSAGAWIALDVPANLVVKDRVSDWRPGQPKPVWTEMMNYLPSDDADVAKLIKLIYGE